MPAGSRPARALHGGADSNTINITLGNRSCRAERPAVRGHGMASLTSEN